ncbi:hypothetical protein ACFW1M_37125 [Streptomyces inhibens]|uniref:hypothetical protein n=1 Tax=Streptomyces inhibens TaxID=2293571 RepID=UPI0036A97B78
MTDSADSIEEVLADEDKVAAQARANVVALLGELTERGCAEPWADLDEAYADDEWPGCLQFSFECPQGHEGDLVMPGVPLAVVKEAAADGRWALLHNDVSYGWADLVEELSVFDAARRTIWANRDLLVSELVRRGIPLQDADVNADPDASGDSWVTHTLAVNGQVVRVSVPDTAVGPGRSQEMYVDGRSYAWEAALEAICAAAGAVDGD